MTSPVNPGTVVYSIGATKVIAEAKVSFASESVQALPSLMEIPADVVRNRRVVIMKSDQDVNAAHESFWSRNPRLAGGTITAKFEDGTYILICKPDRQSVKCSGQAYSITKDTRVKEADFIAIYKLLISAGAGVRNMAMQAPVADGDRVTYESLTAWLQAPHPNRRF